MDRKVPDIFFSRQHIGEAMTTEERKKLAHEVCRKIYTQTANCEDVVVDALTTTSQSSWNQAIDASVEKVRTCKHDSLWFDDCPACVSATAIRGLRK